MGWHGPGRRRALPLAGPFTAVIPVTRVRRSSDPVPGGARAVSWTANGCQDQLDPRAVIRTCSAQDDPRLTNDGAVVPAVDPEMLVRAARAAASASARTALTVDPAKTAATASRATGVSQRTQPGGVRSEPVVRVNSGVSAFISEPFS